MSAGARNLAASVAARLLNRAKRTGDDYQTLLTSFCFERFLYRLAASSVRDRFILKGAMLLRVWSDQPYRATRDLDLLRRGDASFEAILGDIRIACETAVEPDGVVFEPGGARIEAIRAEDEYAGARTMLPARCEDFRQEAYANSCRQTYCADGCLLERRIASCATASVRKTRWLARASRHTGPGVRQVSRFLSRSNPGRPAQATPLHRGLEAGRTVE